MFVKPAPGLKVRDPDSKMHLPDEGKEVPETSFWLRRLADGDVIDCAPSEPVVIQIADSEPSKAGE